MGSATIATKKNRARKLTATANGSITIARHSSDQITDIGGPCARIRYFAQRLSSGTATLTRRRLPHSNRTPIPTAHAPHRSRVAVAWSEWFGIRVM
jgi:hypothetical protein